MYIFTRKIIENDLRLEMQSIRDETSSHQKSKENLIYSIDIIHRENLVKKTIGRKLYVRTV
jgi:hypothetical protein